MAIRALAHPLRVELQGLLLREGAMTAAQAARRLGISQALASHHLRQLAKYDFVEPAEGKDHRERPWRVVATSTSWRDAELAGDSLISAHLLEQVLAERALGQLVDWQRRSARYDPKWQRVTGLSHAYVRLTYEELHQITGALAELLRPYVEARPPGEPHHGDDDRVLADFTWLVSVSPREDEEPT